MSLKCVVSFLFALVIFTTLFPVLRSKERGREHYKFPDNVIKLTNKNFKDLVVRSNDTWVVAFFTTWCVRSHELMPEFLKLADGLEGYVRVGAVDSDKYRKITKQYGITHTPTLLIFGKDKNDPVEYEGVRAKKLVDLVKKYARGEKVNWLEESTLAYSQASFSKSSLGDLDMTIAERDDGITSVTYVDVAMPKLVEITNTNTFLQTCEEAELCIIAFLPNLYNCPPSCRRELLKTFNLTRKAFHTKKWAWTWVEGGVQNELEDYLRINTTRYPVMSIFNWDRKRCVTFTGGFTQDQLYRFLKQLHRANTEQVRTKKLPDIKKTSEWRDEL